MKALYQTCFYLGKKEGERPKLEDAASLCVEWVFAPGEKPRPGLTESVRPAGPLPVFPAKELGGSWAYEAKLFSSGNRRAWGLRLINRDNEDASIQWVTEIVFDETPEGLRVSCVNGVNRVDDSPIPFRRRATAPRIIAMLVEAFGAYDGIPIITKPAWARGRSVDALAAYLAYEKRRHAVVVVSGDEEGKCLFNPTLLSPKLTALAHVFILHGEACHRRFAELIPNPKLLVWDGAARIYYPGFSPEASPFAHPLIGPRSIRESLEERGQSEFCEGILGQIAIAATQRGFPGAVFWDGLDDLIADDEIRKHKESASFSHKVVEVYEEEKKKLLKKIEDLEASQMTLADEKREADGLVKRYFEATRLIRQNVTWREALRNIPEVESVREAIEVAEKELKGRVIFRLNSKSEQESPFQEPTDLLLALRWIGGDYYQAKSGKKVIRDLNASLRVVLSRWDYSANQSDNTMGANDSWYRVDYKLKGGKVAYADAHIGCGASRRPQETIRVAFFWDDDAQVAVIGYVGQHQKNTHS